VRSLDDVLPEYDVRERHERRVAAAPGDALAAALGVPLAPDALVCTLFRLRGVPGGGSVYGTLRALGFEEIVRADDRVVLGAAGRPWSPRGRIVPFASAGPGQVRVAVSIEAAADGDGSRLATETRIAAADASARRAFRRYWLVVGPFSALTRRRWLAAADRALGGRGREFVPALPSEDQAAQGRRERS
jgi:hypothetical protein